MKRRVLWIAGLLLASIVPMTAHAATYFGFSIGTSNGPSPRVYYRQAPMTYMVPNTGVYVVEEGYGDMDEFRYGGYWYVYDNDYWYRSPSYRGPFVAIDVRYVPTQIFYVPSNHWRHYPSFLATQPRWRYRNDRGNWNASGYGRRWNDRSNWNDQTNWRNDRRNDDQWRRDQNSNSGYRDPNQNNGWRDQNQNNIRHDQTQSNGQRDQNSNNGWRDQSGNWHNNNDNSNNSNNNNNNDSNNKNRHDRGRHRGQGD